MITLIYCDTTWAPAGKTPVVEATGARFVMNNVQGALRRLIKLPELVVSFFHTPSRAYAAA